LGTHFFLYSVWLDEKYKWNTFATHQYIENIMKISMFSCYELNWPLFFMV
jgi:hypothetical protein